MKTTITLFLISLTFYCYGQTYDLKDFVETPAPKPGSPEWYSLNNYKNFKDFKTEVVNGKLNISDFDGKTKLEYKLPYGVLWAINEGEIGGELFYLPDDTTQKTIYINGKPKMLEDESRGIFAMAAKDEPSKSRLKVKQFVVHGGNVGIDWFFKFRDSLYFMEGMANMSINKGAIYKIDMKKDGGSITKVMSFDDAPQSMVIKDDTIYIATFKRFYLLNNWKKEMELDDLFWEGLYPNSLAIKDKTTLYTGLRGGYAKINLKTKQITFYKYNPAH